MDKHYDLGTPTFYRKGTVMDRFVPREIASPVKEISKDLNYGVDMERLVKEIKKGTLRFES